MFFPVQSVTQPAGSYDLVSLVTVKDELQITDTNSDVFLGRAISQSSAAIANYCNRVFVPEGVTEQFDVRRDDFGTPIRAFSPLLQCGRYPLISLTSVTQYPANQPSILLVQDTDFRLDLERGTLTRLNIYTGLARNWEEIPLTIAYMAGFGAMATETYDVPATPFQITVAQSDNYNWTQSVSYANGTALVQVPSNPAVGQYAVSAGVYTFNSADAGNSVTIIYAWNNIPDDLQDACLRLITARFTSRGRDPALIEKSNPATGSQRFWAGTSPGQKGALPPEIALLVEHYRAPVVA